MKRIKSLSILTFSLILFLGLLSGCATDQTQNEFRVNEQAAEEHNEIVQLTQEEIEEFDIELATAGPGKLEIHVSLPGEFIIPPDNLAHIHPRFPGMAKKVFKHIGDFVKKGETLAIIEGNESLTEYEVKSLISGTVVEKHLSLGEVVSDMDHGFVVANLNWVWVILNLYQKDLPYVKIGQPVIISAGVDMPEAEGKIDYISPIIDENTRTAEARVILKNPKGIWRPGLFVTGQVTTMDINVDLLVPKTALEYYEDKNVIFVKTSKGFVPRPVRIGRKNDKTVEIIDGLNQGEVFASKNGFTIKSELQKSEFGEGDEH